MTESVTLRGLIGMMVVGVTVGRGVTVGAAVTVGIIGGCVRLPLGRKVRAIATRTTTAVIISIRRDGGGGSGLLAGVDGGATSGIAPTACMDASSVACTASASSLGRTPMIVPSWSRTGISRL